MKNKYFLLVLMLFSLKSIYCQTDNQKKIETINNEISKAVESNDFDKAEKLKNERNLRLELEKAINEGDFDKAKIITAKLEPNNQNNPAKETYIADKSEVSTKKNRVTKSGIYLDFCVLSFGNYSYFGETYSGYYTTYDDNYSYTGFAPGIKFGHRFMFGNKNNRFRFGLDVLWLGYNVIIGGETAIYNMSAIQPGVAFALSFKEDVGINFSFNLGAATAGDDEGTSMGFGFSPNFKFVYKKLTFGVNLNKSVLFGVTDAGYDNFQTFIFGFTTGLKF